MPFLDKVFVILPLFDCLLISCLFMAENFLSPPIYSLNAPRLFLKGFDSGPYALQKSSSLIF